MADRAAARGFPFKEAVARLQQAPPLYKLISTSNHNYLFDVGTNKLLRCAQDEFLLLKYISELGIELGLSRFKGTSGWRAGESTLGTIANAMERENILKLSRFEDFGLYPKEEDVLDSIENKLELMHLEVTNECNLDCRYCVYGDYSTVGLRKHGRIAMSQATAFAAVKYLFNHSGGTGTTAIGFYGGEPAICYSLIKTVVEYAKDLFRNKKLEFQITTNGTLISDEMAQYFEANRFSVLISIDGPKQIHDLWRTYRDGRGSHDRAITGVQKLIAAYEDDPKRLGFSTVYAPPYSERRLSELEDYFFNNPIFPDKPRITITYPASGSVSTEYIMKHRLFGQDNSMMNWSNKTYSENFPNNLDTNPLARIIVEKSLARIMNRKLFDAPIKSTYLNGCCIPASRKLFVTASGKFCLCERIGDAPNVGDTEHGIEISTIKNVYLREYAQLSIKECSTCWIARLCDVCYAQVFTNGQIDLKKKSEICAQKRSYYENQLSHLCSLLEKDSHGLDFLQSYVFR